MKFSIYISIISFALLVSCNPKNKADRIPELEKDKEFALQPQLNALTESIEENPDNDEYYFQRAKIYFEERQFQHALSDINQAITLERDEEGYYFWLAKIYHAVGKPTLALRAAKSAEEFNSQDPELYILMANLFWDIKDLRNSDYYINKAEALAPMHSEIFVLKSKVLVLKGDTATALRTLKSVLLRDRENRDAYKEIITIYERKKLYDTALVYLLEAKEIDSRDPFYPFIEGKIYEGVGLVGSSLVAYNTALERDSTYYPATVRLAKLYENKNDLPTAYNFLKRSYKYESGSLEINLMLAELLQKMGRDYEAIQYYENVKIIDTSNVKVKTTLAALYTAYPDRKPIVISDTAFKHRPVVVTPIDTSKKNTVPSMVKKPVAKPPVPKPVIINQEPEPEKVDVQPEVTPEPVATPESPQIAPPPAGNDAPAGETEKEKKKRLKLLKRDKKGE
ncbi:MAG TPA: tetratricopeptide repeat protein [Cytophagaceae bacterium]|jgi:tetratricopeptide (TPR) repeat protein